MNKNSLIHQLELEVRKFAVDSGGPDILCGPSLFCVVAISDNRLSRTKALAATKWPQEIEGDAYIYPGANTLGYSGPMQIAKSISIKANRDVTTADIWNSMCAYDPQQFHDLCDHYKVLIEEL